MKHIKNIEYKTFLSSFPDEIYFHIFNFLDGNSWLKLLLVCKELNNWINQNINSVLNLNRRRFFPKLNDIFLSEAPREGDMCPRQRYLFFSSEKNRCFESIKTYENGVETRPIESSFLDGVFSVCLPVFVVKEVGVVQQGVMDCINLFKNQEGLIFYQIRNAEKFSRPLQFPIYGLSNEIQDILKLKLDNYKGISECINSSLGDKFIAVIINHIVFYLEKDAPYENFIFIQKNRPKAKEIKELVFYVFKEDSTKIKVLYKPFRNCKVKDIREEDLSLCLMPEHFTSSISRYIDSNSSLLPLLSKEKLFIVCKLSLIKNNLIYYLPSLVDGFWEVKEGWNIQILLMNYNLKLTELFKKLPYSYCSDQIDFLRRESAKKRNHYKRRLFYFKKAFDFFNEKGSDYFYKYLLDSNVYIQPQELEWSFEQDILVKMLVSVEPKDFFNLLMKVVGYDNKARKDDSKRIQKLKPKLKQSPLGCFMLSVVETIGFGVSFFDIYDKYLNALKGKDVNCVLGFYLLWEGKNQIKEFKEDEFLSSLFLKCNDSFLKENPHFKWFIFYILLNKKPSNDYIYVNQLFNKLREPISFKEIYKDLNNYFNLLNEKFLMYSGIGCFYKNLRNTFEKINRDIEFLGCNSVLDNGSGIREQSLTFCSQNKITSVNFFGECSKEERDKIQNHNVLKESFSILPIEDNELCVFLKAQPGFEKDFYCDGNSFYVNPEKLANFKSLITLFKEHGDIFYEPGSRGSIKEV